MSLLTNTLKKSLRVKLFRAPVATLTAIKLNHQRIFILPTSRGLAFVILIALMLMIAFIYNNNLSYLLVFLLISVFVVTILHSFKALAGLVIQTGQAHASYAGDKVKFDFYIDNPSSIERFALQFKLLLTDSSLDVLNQINIINLKAQEKKIISLYSPTQKRGWHVCEKLILSSTYPLGLFRAWSVLYFDFKALVYPKPASEQIPFPESVGEQAQQGNSKKGQGDFYGLREYQEGDAIRDIHWKAYAKGQGLFSKYYSSEALAELWLDYKQTRASDTEQRLSQLCRWLIDADESGLQYGFILAELTIQPSSGSEHFKKCLKALALF